jgi:hypothetical protein
MQQKVLLFNLAVVNNDTKWGMWLNNNIYICNGICTRYNMPMASTTAPKALPSTVPSVSLAHMSIT